MRDKIKPYCISVVTLIIVQYIKAIQIYSCMFIGRKIYIVSKYIFRQNF